MAQVSQIGLVWIVVKNLDEAVRFYTETVGLKLHNRADEFGWAELGGHEGGAFLGLALEKEDMKAGQNAWVTFSVKDLDNVQKELAANDSRFNGEINVIPGHVKMLNVQDPSGNNFQLCESLEPAFT